MLPEAPLDGEARAGTLLVGREREQRLLNLRLDALLDGHGALALISGEAGIGKTSLVRGLATAAAARGCLVVTGTCYDAGVTVPYGPWRDLVDAGARRRDLPQIPAMGNNEEWFTAAPTADAVVATMRAYVDALIERAPLLIVLEDLHWADAESLEFLRILARRLSDVPLLLVTTYRDHDLTPNDALSHLLPHLVREANAERIRLRGLDASAITTLVDQRYGLNSADLVRLTTHLEHRSQGIPFYVKELLRTLEEEERLHLTANGWILEEIDQNYVPPLVQQVTDGRLKRFDSDARELLELAAVIGQDVPLLLWRRLSGASDELFGETVERATQAHVFASGPSGMTVQFAHALVRDSLYQSTPLPRRQRWHRQIAEALAMDGDRQPDIVAHHFRQAFDPRAVTWFIRAGSQAERVAWLTAATHFGAALEMMESLDVNPGERGWLLLRRAGLLRPTDPHAALAILDTAESIATEARDTLLHSYVTYYRGQTRCVTGEMKAGMVDLEAGVAALTQLTPQALERVEELERLGVVMSRIEMRGLLAAMLAIVGRIAEALERTQEVTERTDGKPIWAWGARGVALALAGEPEAAHDAFVRCLDALRSISDTSMSAMVVLNQISVLQIPYGADDLTERRRVGTEGESAWLRSGGSFGDVSARLTRVPELLLEGSWSEAYALALSGVQSSDRSSTKFLFAAVHLGHLARSRGEVTLAWQQVRRVLPAGSQSLPGHTDIWPSLEMVRLAVALSLDASEPMAARTWLDLHDHWLEWSGALLGRAASQLLWAEVFRQSGELERTREQVNQALALADTPRQPLVLLAAHRLLGELETQVGQFSEARQQLTQALDLAAACAATYERALTLLAFADLEHQAGNAGAALDALNTARSIFSELGAAPALARAEALATQFAGGHGDEPATTFGLSPRETEVLRLIANGARNREIAEELFLSVRTVERHIANLYAKIRVSGRSEAIAFAHAHHLR